jgi:hypothetical protein
MPLAKMAKYAKKDELSNMLFAVFTVAWIPTRHGFFFYIYHSVWTSVEQHPEEVAMVGVCFYSRFALSKHPELPLRMHGLASVRLCSTCQVEIANRCVPRWGLGFPSSWIVLCQLVHLPLQVRPQPFE